MGKPISRVAIALWVVTAIALLAYGYSEEESVRGQIALFAARDRITALPAAVNPYAMDVGSMGGVAIQAGILVGLGWVIELVDRILWHIKKPDIP